MGELLRGRLIGTSGGGGGGGSTSPVVPLSRRGLHLVRPDGSICKYEMETAFSAFDDWMHGRFQKLHIFAEHTRSINRKGWRVFGGAWANVGLKPQGARTYTEMNLFFKAMRDDEHLYIHWVGLCDQVAGSPVHISRDEQISFLRESARICEEAGNVLFENFNEAEKNDDDDVCRVLTPSDYGRMPATRTWWGEDRHWNSEGSLLQWTTGHTDRGTEWTRQFLQALDVSRRGYRYTRDGGGDAPPTGVGHVLGEPRRIAEGTTPRQHADYQAGSKLYGIGGCLHGGFKSINPAHESDLQNCIPPDGLALECCQAVRDVDASTLWPANTPDGNHVRGGVDNWNNDNKSDCPIIHRDRYFGGPPEGEDGAPAGEYPDGAVRSFFMELGGKWYGLAVDPGPDWRLKVRSGWKLVAQGGFDDGVHGGNMLVLERAA